MERPLRGGTGAADADSTQSRQGSGKSWGAHPVPQAQGGLRRADRQIIHLLDYPPDPSKYHPIERCWGILEPHWNGTKRVDAETLLQWAKRMTWKGLHPVVKVSRRVYRKGLSISNKALRPIEARLERNPSCPRGIF